MKRIGILLLILTLACVLPAAAADAADGHNDLGEPVSALSQSPAPSARLSGDESLPALDAPSNLTWGTDYTMFSHKYLAQENEDPPLSAPIPGVFSWNQGETHQNRTKLRIYRTEAEGDVLIDSSDRWYSGRNAKDEEDRQVCSCFRFILDSRESGDYYFTIQNAGDGVDYTDGPTATSEVWHYENPGAAIPTPATPVFTDGVRFSWDDPENDQVLAYYVKTYYAPDRNAEPQELSGWIQTSPRTNDTINDSDLMEGGEGYYSVRVRALSRDITKADHSAWSQPSEAVFVAGASDVLQKIVDRLPENAGLEEKQDVIDWVRDLDPEALAAAMAADTQETGVNQQLRRLEELVGTTPAVVVKDDALSDVFDEDQVSILGAGLNVDAGEQVSLVIDRAEDSAVAPAMYRNTVQFSMHLEDGSGEDITRTGDLFAPVKITLPVPAGVNPEFLDVIHRHADGTLEVVERAYVYERDGAWYVSFVIYSFSDFTLAEGRASARLMPEGVEITLGEDAPDADRVLCALYEADGKQLAVSAPDLTGQPVLLPCDSGRCAVVRLLFLKEGCLPQEAAWSFPPR